MHRRKDLLEEVKQSLGALLLHHQNMAQMMNHGYSELAPDLLLQPHCTTAQVEDNAEYIRIHELLAIGGSLVPQEVYNSICGCQHYSLLILVCHPD